MAIRAVVLALLAVALAWAAEPTLIISYTASYSGSISTTYQYMYFVVNNSSKPLEVFGRAVPPYGASLIYVPVNGSYPPPVAVFYNITYINSSLINNILYCNNNSIITINIKIKNYMPFDVPVTILIQKTSGIDIISNATPSGVESLGGSTVYQWTFLVADSRTFSVSYRIRDFGDFGAVNLPPVEIISTIDLSGYIDQTERSIVLLNNTYNYLNNLTYAVNIFNNIIYNTTNNLDNLARLLNLSSTAFREGARGLNASQYVVYALNAQLSAMASSLMGVASTLNRSLLLVQYEYAYLVALSNALAAQATAINAYENSLSTSVATLNSIENNLATIYSSLQNIESSINSVYLNLLSLKQKVNQIKSNNTLVENATKELDRQLDYAIAVVQSAQSTIGSAEASVGALMSIISNTKNALVKIGGQLGEVEGVLNQTAVATRQNATAILEELPPVILNASRALTYIANNLTLTASQIGQMTGPINNGVRYLTSAASTLSYTANEIEAVSNAMKGELPYIGLVNSIISSYRYNITKSIQKSQYFISIANSYKNIYGTGSIRYTMTISLPIAVNPSKFTFNITTPSTSQGGKSGVYSIYFLLIIIISILATISIILKIK
ncbi:MAG: hypothetical protein ABWJ97_00440 [Thermoproteus sp.]